MMINWSLLHGVGGSERISRVPVVTWLMNGSPGIRIHAVRLPRVYAFNQYTAATLTRNLCQFSVESMCPQSRVSL